jgi:hypothetical protein
MAVKLGTSSVTLKLGTQSVTGYLGSVIVTVSVPGAPTILTATSAGFGNVNVTYTAPDSDGGSAITAYKFYIDGSEATPSSSSEGAATFSTGTVGSAVEVSAVNAIGEGPKSAPVNATSA